MTLRRITLLVALVAGSATSETADTSGSRALRGTPAGVASSEQEMRANATTLTGMEVAVPPASSGAPMLGAARAASQSGCSDYSVYCTYWSGQGYCTGGWMYQQQPISTYWCQATCSQCGGGGGGDGGDSGSPVANAIELADLINQYRRSYGLQELPLSPALMEVASAHVKDLNRNKPDASTQCNMHSWSTVVPSYWSGCCYTDDHAQSECMWKKGKEITSCFSRPYTGNTFENAHGGWGIVTPSGALDGWKTSSGHNQVILNQGIWARYNPWQAMGVGIEGSYAVAWFGDQQDPNGAFESNRRYEYCGPSSYRPEFA